MAVIKEFSAGSLRVRVFDSRASMGECAGKEIAEYMRELLKEEESINVMFAAAPSQNETLATLCAEKGIDWTRVNAFHMDEYVGLDEEHPAGFRNYLRRTIFGILPFKSVNLLNGNAPDTEEEAERYSALLRENPLDICILGVGENGHIAFNDPPVADFNDKKLVKTVKLDERCRIQQVNDGCFEKVEDVPSYALSATIPLMCSAPAMFCSVPAATKAEAVLHMLDGNVTTKCPASILTVCPGCKLYLDADSAKYIL